MLGGRRPHATEARSNMALTDLAIRRVKAESKIRKLLDGGDLQLRVTPADAKRWRLA